MLNIFVYIFVVLSDRDHFSKHRKHVYVEIVKIALSDSGLPDIYKACSSYFLVIMENVFSLNISCKSIWMNCSTLHWFLKATFK